MSPRIALTAAAIVTLTVALGCRKPESGSSGASQEASPATPDPAPVEVAPADIAAVPSSGGDAGQLAALCRQMDGLVGREKVPLTEVEALGWTISARARELCERYYHATRPRGEAKLEDVLAMEETDYEFSKAPPHIRDLERVAICAESVARSAGILDEAGVRESYAGLRLAASRCMTWTPTK